MVMKKKSPVQRPKKAIDWEAVCERNRRECSSLSDEERRRLQTEALRIIYTANAEAPARSR